MYKDGDVVNTFDKMFEHPMNDFANYNICGSVDSPEPDDDTCSMAEVRIYNVIPIPLTRRFFQILDTSII